MERKKKVKEKSTASKIRAFFGMGTPSERAKDKKAGRNTGLRGKQIDAAVDKATRSKKQMKGKRDEKGRR